MKIMPHKYSYIKDKLNKIKIKKQKKTDVLLLIMFLTIEHFNNNNNDNDTKKTLRNIDGGPDCQCVSNILDII